MPTHKAYTFASLTCHDTNQSLQKSMLSPALRKNKKSPRLKKNKTMPTHKPTQIAAHLILPNHTQSPPTTRQVGRGQFEGNF